VSSLGAAVGGNAKELNDAIRRASPALRETDRVLAILARQNKVVRDLNQHADTVVGELARSKRDVGDWVVKARDISRDSAQRERDISAGWRKLPAFLAELRPAMAALGRTAETQGPALRTLAGNAEQLQRFFDDLRPFSDASRPAFRALGQASSTGRQAVTAATPTVRRLNQFAGGTPELGGNLATVLEHLDDRGNAIEYDKRAAVQQGVKEPSGYSGLEGLLQYVFDQATSTNVYDQASHVLTVQAFHEDGCVDYHDAQMLDKEPETKAKLLKQCQAKLGPNTPGVETFDPSADDAPERKLDYVSPTGGPIGSARERHVLPDYQDLLQGDQPQAPAEAPRGDEQPQQDAKPGGGGPPSLPKPPAPPSVPQPNLPPPPPLPSAPPLPDPGKGLPGRDGGQGPLLDYLLGS
ncbi:MAG TPA: hypothetical protein VGJ32_05280, partial [Solirubrobacteraceae bacterium]